MWRYDLRDALAEIYSDAPSAQRILDQVGIDTRHLVMHDAIINVWGRAVDVASEDGLIDTLLATALAERPNNAALKRVETIREWLIGRGSKGDYMAAGSFPSSNYNPQLGERVARLEEKHVTLGTQLTDGFKKVEERFDSQDKKLDSQSKRLDELALAVAAKAIPTVQNDRLRGAINSAGLVVSILIIAGLLLYILSRTP